MQVLENILKHLFRSKCLYQYVKVFYDFEIMFAKLNEAQLKLEELGKIRSIMYCKNSQACTSNLRIVCSLFKRSFRKKKMNTLSIEKNISWMYILKG